MDSFDPKVWRPLVELALGAESLTLWIEEDNLSIERIGLEGVEPPKGTPEWNDWAKLYGRASALLLADLTLAAKRRVVCQPDYIDMDRHIPFFQRFTRVQQILTRLHEQSLAESSQDVLMADSTPIPATASASSSVLGSRPHEDLGHTGLTPKAKRTIKHPSLSSNPPPAPVFSTPTPASRRPPPKTPTTAKRYLSGTISSMAKSTPSTQRTPSRSQRTERIVPTRRLPPLWQSGLKCVVCGDQSGYDTHPSYGCNATVMASSDNAPTLVKYMGTPEGHLVHEDGRQLCFPYNCYRYPPAIGCDFVACPYEHICSLCGGAHSAIDCDARVYEPVLPESTVELQPIPTDPDLVHCRVIDSFFDLKPKVPHPPRRELLDLSNNDQPRLVWDVTESLSWDKRKKLHEMYQSAAFPAFAYPRGISGEPQQYPNVVPSRVTVRPGYNCRLVPSHFKDSAGDELGLDILRLFDSAQGPARQLDMQQLKEQFESDKGRFVRIKRLESERNVSHTELDLTSEGLPGDARFQFTDGNLEAASVVIMAHYPPAHHDPYGFTRTKHGGQALGQEGLLSPTLCGDGRLAFMNVVPSMFVVDEDANGGIRMKSGKSYPSPIIDNLKTDAVSGILDRARRGTQQLVVGWGALPRSVITEAGLKAAKDAELRVNHFEISVRTVRQWEAGISSTELLVMRQEHLGTNASIKSERLFGPVEYLNTLEDNYAKADEKGDNRSVRLHFTAIRPRTGVNKGKCMLLLAVDHMTTSLLPQFKGGFEAMQKMDLAITLVEDLMFRRFKSRCYPKPVWRFMQSHARGESDAGCLSSKEIQNLQSMNVWEQKRGVRVEPSALLPSFEKLWRSVSLDETTEKSKGLQYTGDKTDIIAILVSASQSRAARLKGNKPATPREQAQQDTWRSKGSDAKRTDTERGLRYVCFCYCGFEGFGCEYEAGTNCQVPIATLCPADKHNGPLPDGQKSCLGLLPVDPVLLARVKIKRKADKSGNRLRIPSEKEWEKIHAGLELYKARKAMQLRRDD